MANINAPLTALVLAMADEMINDLQASHDQFGEDGDWDTAKQISTKIERLSMLQSMVELQAREQEEQKNTATPIEAITAYLQEHDPDVFPISMRGLQNSKLWLLETTIGISETTAEWLDEVYPGIIVLSLSPRQSPLNHSVQAQFQPTLTPGFVPERIQAPPRPAEYGAPHKADINPGMPMDGPAQGMPGGKLGDK